MSVRPTVEPLTRRQRQVLELLARGHTNYEIAQRLGVSLDGAKWHVREVLGRLGVESREQAAEVWRRENSWRTRATAALPFAAAGKVALAAAVAALVVVGAGAFVLLGGEDDQSSLTPDATVTPSAASDDLEPRSGISVVDQVVDIAKRGDLAAFQGLMKEFPEPCTSGQRGVGSPPACPPGAADGTPVETFRAIAAERVDPGDLDQVLGNVVPNLRTMHGVARAQPDTFSGFIPAWKYEVMVYGTVGAGQTWSVYFLDDTGIVGLYASNSFGVTNRRDAIPDGDWLIVPIGFAHLTSDKALYVLGRDAEVRFSASLPTVCAGKPAAVRLYAYPPPGVAGGIQVPGEPGLAIESRAAVNAKGEAVFAFPLPASASSPLRMRPGLLSSCLGDIAVQGEIELALPTPADDALVATFEFLGAAFDLPRSDGLTVGENIRSLTATIDGVSCVTHPTADAAIRNSRGNLVFRVGTSDQPTACRAPGRAVTFLMGGLPGSSLEGTPLSEKPGYFAGTIRLIRNFGPEPPR